MSMIEVVARVLCKENGTDPDEMWGSDEDREPNWRLYAADARAAIAALRVPSEAMVTAGEDDDHSVDPEATWRAMIDAALAEPTTGE